MALTGLDAVNQLSGALVRAGFRRRHRSDTGSRYLYLPPHPFELRVSDHRWSGWSGVRQCQVVCSHIVSEINQIDLDVEAARIKEKYLERITYRHKAAARG